MQLPLHCCSRTFCVYKYEFNKISRNIKHTYMILRQFYDTTDASDVYDAWPITLYIFRAFGKKTEESGGHEKYRRQIYGRVTGPTFKWVAIEKRSSKGLGGFMFRRIFVVEKGRSGTKLSCAGCKIISISRLATDQLLHELVDKDVQLSFFFFNVGFDFQNALLIRDIHL